MSEVILINRSFRSPEEFWEQNSGYQDRKFYVALCLLESALGDYAVARDLHIHNKLNWACITYYYSLVHALRLICFMALGDFPTQHDKLAQLFKDGTCRGRGWLSARHFQDSRLNINPVNFSLPDIVSALASETTPEVEQKLRRWGKILNKGRELRRDTNYEGLIIAHQYAHQRVSEDFRNLADLFKRAAEEILPEVVGFFKNFIDHHDRKEYWYAFLNYQEESKGLYYLEETLRYKLLGESTRWFSQERVGNDYRMFDTNSGQQIIELILQWLNPLRDHLTDNAFAREVLGNIRLGIFTAKQSLMESFREGIESLKCIIEGDQ